MTDLTRSPLLRRRTAGFLPPVAGQPSTGRRGSIPALSASAHPWIERPALLEAADQQMKVEDAGVTSPARERLGGVISET